jgi:hypothetical protein
MVRLSAVPSAVSGRGGTQRRAQVTRAELGERGIESKLGYDVVLSSSWPRRGFCRKAWVLDEYLIHYNGHRPHRTLGQRPPHPTTPPATGAVQRRRILSGLIYEYHRAA